MQELKLEALRYSSYLADIVPRGHSIFQNFKHFFSTNKNLESKKFRCYISIEIAFPDI